MPKPLTVCVTANWKIHQEMGISDHHTCLLRNLFAGQEATARIRYETMDWFQIGKGIHQGCILSPCLFNLYAELIMLNVMLDEAQAGIKSVGRNINNLRYSDNITLMAESTEELKSLLMKVKEESEKFGLKFNIEKTKIMALGPINSLQISGETMEIVRDFISWTSKSLYIVTTAMKIKDACSCKKSYFQPRQHIKNRHITLPLKVHLVKAMVSPVGKYGCKSWTIKKADCQRIDPFELWCWTSKRSNQSIVKEISPKYSLEWQMLKLRLQ